MADKVAIPVFDTDQCVEYYIEEVEAWTLVTNVKKKCQAIVLVLALKENLRRTIWNNVSKTDLNKEDGVNTYLKFLKSTYGKDDLLDSLDKYRDFRDYKRQVGQTITDFITEFASKVTMIEKKGMHISEEVLAFELIQKAGITPDESKLVATGLDFTSKGDLCNQAKQSLKKFLGENSKAISSAGSDRAIRVEDRGYGIEDIAYNDSYSTRGHYNNHSNSDVYYRGMGMQNNQDYYQINEHQDRNRGNYQSERQEISHQEGRQEGFNPVGRDGKPLRCYSCGSDRHLKRDCNNFTTQSESYDYWNTQEEILFTGMDDHGIQGVIDTAHASTCTGENWMFT